MANIKELNKSITEMEGEEATSFIHAVRERRFKKDNLTGEALKKKEAKKEVIKKAKPKKVMLAEAVDNLTKEQKQMLLDLMMKGKGND